MATTTTATRNSWRFLLPVIDAQLTTRNAPTHLLPDLPLENRKIILSLLFTLDQFIFETNLQTIPKATISAIDTLHVKRS